MALNTQPGFTGFSYGRISSFDGRSIGKFTDTNKLEASHDNSPADYDKKVISIYTQSGLYSNDFLELLNQSTPYYIEGNSDAWQWEITAPYQYPRIIEVPADTANRAKVGIDGQEFQIVVDKDDYGIHKHITPNVRFGPSWYITKEPEQYGSHWLLTLTLVTTNPLVDYVNPQWLTPGLELVETGMSVGEFDDNLPGLKSFGDRIKMYESLGSAVGYQHHITGWADDRRVMNQLPTDSNGQPLDLLVYMKNRRNETPISKNNIRWEPYVEFLIRKEMLELKVQKFIWNKAGTTKTDGSRQEVKKSSAGLYHRLKGNGNYTSYPRGAGNMLPTLFRRVFGDLFYRRVPMPKRKVKIYTNEAGFDVFDQALKNNAFNSGLTFAVADSDKFVEGKGQNLVLNFGFSSMITRETGKVDLVHLAELDQPMTNSEFGQNIKSAPIFIVLDISPDGDGTLKGNLREVRYKTRPSMTWGYIDGRRSHLGAFASQGHSAATMQDGYTTFYDDRYDFFIEDMSRCALIEEEPQYAIL